jgi:hypothetical protein
MTIPLCKPRRREWRSRLTVKVNDAKTDANQTRAWSQFCKKKLPKSFWYFNNLIMLKMKKIQRFIVL